MQAGAALRYHVVPFRGGLTRARCFNKLFVVVVDMWWIVVDLWCIVVNLWLFVVNCGKDAALCSAPPHNPLTPHNQVNLQLQLIHHT